MIDQWLHSGSIISLPGGRVLVGWGKLYKAASAKEALKTGGFYFPDFFLQTPYSWLIYENMQEFKVEELLKFFSQQNKAQSSALVWENPHHSLFCTTFKELMQQMADQILHKAVPFIFESTPVTMSPALLHSALSHALTYIQHYPAYLYGFWNTQEGMSEGMLGVTPELLFRYGQENLKRMHTMACAGTSSKQEGATMARSPKDGHEHDLVIQGIEEALKPFGSVRIGKREVLSLPTLNHLLTPILVDLNDLPHFDHLVAALHPTPALGAFPKEKGRAWLESYQKKIDRKRFGAPAGYVTSDGEASCYVAIRNVQWDNRHMFIGAGCGVIAASLCEKEWSEIRLKLQAIKSLLGL